ncbi:MAG: hypothetical protein HYU25_15570 [Candidatus Rokubacteria bacterium]|nr:hypothetical protein [Candidatus Rokubacteria bacterium]
MGTGLLARAIVTAGREASQERSTMESYDDLLARVEERVPGFGGMFVGQDGRLAVYLLDLSQLAAARSAIEAVFGAQRVPAAGVRALQGQYTVSQLKQWTERATEMLGVSGVTTVDLDEAKNRVAIGLEDDSATQTVEQALASLGIPREAVVIEVTGQIRPLDRPQPKSRSTDQVRP